MAVPNGYRCSSCEQWHEGLPTAYGPDAPIYWYQLTADERAARFILETDYSVFDRAHFFVRCALQIPIVGHDAPFVWVSWVSLSKSNYLCVAERTPSSVVDTETPMFGWLSSALEGYPSTVNLKVNVYNREHGKRPTVLVEPTDHPLAIEQREGITWQRVQEIAELVHHKSGGA
jgi:hypothetical protein